MGFKKGIIPWNKGKKLSKEIRDKFSKSHMGLIHSGTFKKGHPSYRKGIRLDNNLITKDYIEGKSVNEIAKLLNVSEGKIYSVLKKNKTKMSKVGYKKNNIPWNKNTKGLMSTPWNKDKQLSKEHIEKLKLAKIGYKPNQKGLKEYYKNNQVWNKGIKGLYKNPNSYFKKGMTAWNKGITPAKETIKKMLKRNLKSSLEIKFEDIINKLSLPYKFVGNGELLIARKSPDFVDKNGKKIAIEVFYRKHKQKFRGNIDLWKADRIKVFNENGWQVIFFDETEVNELTVKNKLAVWNGLY